MQGNLLTLVPDIQNVLGRLKRELLEPVVALYSNTQSSETQTTTPEPPRHRGIPDPDILPNTTPDVLRIQPRYTHFTLTMRYDFNNCINFVLLMLICIYLFFLQNNRSPERHWTR